MVEYNYDNVSVEHMHSQSVKSEHYNNVIPCVWDIDRKGYNYVYTPKYDLNLKFNLCNTLWFLKQNKSNTKGLIINMSNYIYW